MALIFASLYCLVHFVTYCAAESEENIYNLTTFNTYQIVINPYKTETREIQFDVIHSKYADITDVYCLNELFYQNDTERYQNEFINDFPYSYSELEEWKDDELILPQIACSTSIIDKLNDIKSNKDDIAECFDECVDDFIDKKLGSLKTINCIIDECLIGNIGININLKSNSNSKSDSVDSTYSDNTEDIENTDDESLRDQILDFLREFQRSSCLHCLGISLLKWVNDPNLSFTSIINNCLLPLDYNFKPTSGLLILSKKPLLNKRMITMPSSFDFPRSMIMADIEIDDELKKTVSIGCIHPQAPYPGKTRKDSLFPYVGFDEEIMNLGIDSFEELTALQMMLIGEHIKEIEKEQNFVLMGDFNVGPNFVEDIYHNFMDYTFMQNIFNEQELEDIHCTYCHDNDFNQNIDEDEQLIDHIVYQQISHIIEAKEKYRCYDDRELYEINGEMVEKHISDHYGICSNLQFHVPV